VLARRAEGFEPRCPECGGSHLEKLISRFAFHQSFQSKLEQLDPKYEKMVDASNPDLSFDSLVKKYKLDRPITRPDTS
jgi:hypothetical protein